MFHSYDLSLADILSAAVKPVNEFKAAESIYAVVNAYFWLAGLFLVGLISQY